MVKWYHAPLIRESKRLGTSYRYCGGGAMVARGPHKPETTFESSDRSHLKGVKMIVIFIVLAIVAAASQPRAGGSQARNTVNYSGGYTPKRP